MSGRGKVDLGIVRDPAVAIAMSKCWLYTITTRAKKAGIDLGLSGAERFLHQTNCGFCEVPRDLLIKAIEEFVDWSGVSSFDHEVPLKAEIEAFETLNKDEQQRLVNKAAGILEYATDEPEDMPEPNWWSAR